MFPVDPMLARINKVLGRDVSKQRIFKTIEDLLTVIEKQRDEIQQYKSQTRFKSFLEIASENLQLAEQLKEAQTRVAFFEGLRSAK